MDLTQYLVTVYSKQRKSNCLLQ